MSEGIKKMDLTICNKRKKQFKLNLLALVKCEHQVSIFYVIVVFYNYIKGLLMISTLIFCSIFPIILHYLRLHYFL